MRAALSGANTQLDEEQVKERVQIQMEYIDAEAASVRARAWAGDSEAVEPAKRIGDRMHICLSEALGGDHTWFPSAAVVAEVIARRQAEVSARSGPLSSA